VLADCTRAAILLQKNAEHVVTYSKTLVWRKHYMAKHPTVIVVLKCMDGRIHYSVMVQLAPGIVIPFRNMGGIFDLGWLYFGQIIEEIVMQAMAAGLPVHFIITYHWSEGDPQRGCRAFNYDVEKARDYAFELKAQFDRFSDPSNNSVVYKTVIGIETDTDTLVIHGEDPCHVMDLGKLEEGTSEAWIDTELHHMLPSMSNRVREDFIPHITGNLEHQADVRKEGRSDLECHHRETVTCVGRWWDWLHELNLALIIGPLSCDTVTPIRGAASVMWENYMLDNSLADDGFVLMTSAPYSTKVDPYYSRAKEKANYLANLAYQTMIEQQPGLEDILCVMPGLVSTDTREFTQIPFERRTVR